MHFLILFHAKDIHVIFTSYKYFSQNISGMWFHHRKLLTRTLFAEKTDFPYIITGMQLNMFTAENDIKQFVKLSFLNRVWGQFCPI